MNQPSEMKQHGYEALGTETKQLKSRLIVGPRMFTVTFLINVKALANEDILLPTQMFPRLPAQHLLRI